LILSVEPRSVLRSYTFLVVSLLFGLPLAVSYYAVSEGVGYAPLAVVLYVLGSLAAGLLLLVRRRVPIPAVPPPKGASESPPRGGSPAALWGVALLFATGALASLWLMKYFVAVAYPYPSASADSAGAAYLVCVLLASVLGFPLLVRGAFSVVRSALSGRRMKVLAATIGVAYFFTYEFLVNEIVVTGYNSSPGTFVPSPVGTYPFAYVFTTGPSPANFVENAIYSPYVLIQLNKYVNLIFQPFEVILAVAASVLVASTVVVTYNYIRRSERMGGACSASATLSGVGAFLGYTATCPSCLAPTLISVAFGGLASVQAVYSNLWGVVIPPVVSIGALLASLVVLQRTFGRPQVPAPQRTASRRRDEPGEYLLEGDVACHQRYRGASEDHGVADDLLVPFEQHVGEGQVEEHRDPGEDEIRPVVPQVESVGR
jgi:hypothetical protein